MEFLGSKDFLTRWYIQLLLCWFSVYCRQTTKKFTYTKTHNTTFVIYVCSQLHTIFNSWVFEFLNQLVLQWRVRVFFFSVRKQLYHQKACSVQKMTTGFLCWISDLVGASRGSIFDFPRSEDNQGIFTQWPFSLDFINFCFVVLVPLKSRHFHRILILTPASRSKNT